jgi:hypothetical protein
MITIKKNNIEKEEKIEKNISKEAFVYVGETVANHRINIVKNSIVKNLDNYKKIFKEIPGLIKLFIKISDYAEVKTRMRDENSWINKKIIEVGKRMREEKDGI